MRECIFGKKVKDIAKSKGIKLKDMAKQLNISYSYLMHILNGSKPLTDALKKKICTTLNLTRDERNELNEAAFISNEKIEIYAANKKECLLRLFYWLTIRANWLTEEQINKMIDDLKDMQKSGKTKKQL